MTKKDELLGQSFGTASGRLRKVILFDLLQRFDLDQCFQCEQKIEDVDEMSIEHKEPWQEADDPKATFFDLENIAFSHLRCNKRANAQSRRTHCPAGHPYDEDNTYRPPNQDGRRCRVCHNQREKARHRISKGR